MANPFVHVELHTNDLAKAKSFYSKAVRLEAQGHAPCREVTATP